MNSTRKALAIAMSVVAMACAGAALAQHHGGSGSGHSPGGGGNSGWHGGGTNPGWHGGGTNPGWHGGGSNSGWRGGSGRIGGPRFYGHRSYGYYPRFGYYAPPFFGYYGPAYYDAYPYYVTPYYDYVEPPVVYYQAPQIAQVTPPPPPEPRPAAPPPAPAPQPTPAPRTFERYTLSASELFAFDRAELTMPQPKLDQIAAALIASPQIANVRITGYTDRLGTDAYNLRLSQRRADAVKSYLVSRGVPDNRLVAIGRGEADPIVFCHQKQRTDLIDCLRPNRRVVVEQITVERPR